MDDLLRIAVQWLHVASGVLWIGAGAYALLVILPALEAMAPAARGPAMAEIAPRQVRYVLRMAEVTLATGVANLLVSGRARLLEDPLGSRWAIVMTVGIVLAVVIYGILRGAVVPLMRRMLALGPKAASGDAAAAGEVAAMRGRLRGLATTQVALGLTVILAMVAARFS
ncbi:MAG TPA: hypothetical protein VFM93_04425 [Candidatus Limnocylindria bacterium]|nr:hypothetical protein [Candidatus Limnocylindria bacterium]